MKISGKSLEEDGIHDGDIVVIDPDAEVLDGKLYVVRIGLEVTCKRIFHEGDSLRLTSSNGKYEIMEQRRVECLGKVVASGHWTKVI